MNKTLVGFGQLLCGKLKPKCYDCPVVKECTLGRELVDIEELEQESQAVLNMKGKKKLKT